jgi:hypothetical protein
MNRIVQFWAYMAMLCAQWSWILYAFFAKYFNWLLHPVKMGVIYTVVNKLSLVVNSLRASGWWPNKGFELVEIITRSVVTGFIMAASTARNDLFPTAIRPIQAARDLEVMNALNTLNTGVGLMYMSSIAFVIITTLVVSQMLHIVGCDVWWLWNQLSVDPTNPPIIDMKCDTQTWSICVSQNIYPDIDLAEAEVQLRECLKLCREAHPNP